MVLSSHKHPERFKFRLHYGICLLLVLCTLAVFWQVKDFEFVNYDDDLYVFENPWVQSGVTSEGILWSLQTTRGGNWHPVTWFSHMMDVELHGLDPGRHHLTNLFFHTLNTLLIFLLFKRMTGQDWQSGFLALLFAIHPGHVESVVWVAQRKDVLSVFFGLLTVGAYYRYAQRQNMKRYMAVLLLFALGLMAKPMLVSLPFVLLLLDLWPIQRFGFDNSGPVRKSKSIMLSLLAEKLPLFLFSLAIGGVTYYAQQQSGAVRTLDVYPLTTRVANALVSYVLYIKKMIMPVDLALPYPHPGAIPVWKSVSSFLVLMIITLMVLKARQHRPYLMVGWLWYIGSLAPVIGIIQVGSQAMADRYTYLPLVGLFIILTWGGADLVVKWRLGAYVAPGVAGACAAVLILATGFQTGYWKNSITLLKHTIEVTENNYVACNNLGVSLAEKNRFAEAMQYYARGLKIYPHYIKLYHNMGDALYKTGRIDEAIQQFKQALQIKPTYAKAHIGLGNAFSTQGRLDLAIHHFNAALSVQPDHPTAHNNLGNALQRQGRLDDALRHYRAALRAAPKDAAVYNNLGVVYLRKGEAKKAILQFQRALRLQPEYKEAKNNLKMARSWPDTSGNQRQRTDRSPPGTPDEPLNR